jgi:NAD(P)-dependent dehydrogenase (short-subunit alcohol dehydrogenase family)
VRSVFGRIAELMSMVAFLASDKADYIIGYMLCVNGGMVI